MFAFIVLLATYSFNMRKILDSEFRLKDFEVIYQGFAIGLEALNILIMLYFHFLSKRLHNLANLAVLDIQITLLVNLLRLGWAISLGGYVIYKREMEI